MGKANGLTPKQQRFVDEYLVDLNATQAAIRAGYSEKTAQQMGSENLSKPVVANAIAAGRLAQQGKSEVDAFRVLKEYIAVGLSDIGDILDFSGTNPRIRPACDIPEHARRAIASIKVKRHTEGVGEAAREVEVLEFRLWPKLEALREVAARVETAKTAAPIQVDVTSGGKPIEQRNTLTAADIAAAAALVAAAGRTLHPDGGPEPVDPGAGSAGVEP